MSSNITKRIWSVILVFAMVLSFLPAGSLFASAAAANPGSKTDGQIVAENYELSETEEKLIASGYLIGQVHSYLKPAAEDNLITVDVDTTTITAKNYEGTDGYVWVPVSAVIEVSGNVEETVLFTGNQATYTYDGDAFAVKVNYELRLTVSESDQQTLLNAPFYLQQVMQMMDAVAAAREKLALMEESEVVDILKQMNTAEGYPVMTNVSMYFRDEVFADAKYTEKEAATALLAQMDANGGKLNISVIADEYAAAASKIEYIINNADRINAEIISTRDYVYSITAEGCVLPSAATLAGYANHPMASALNSLINGLKAAVEHMEEAMTKDYASGVKNAVKPGLTPVEYAALDTLVLALGALTDVSAIVPQNPLLADTEVVQFNMAMFDVTANVVLMVVEDVVGSDTLVTYDTKTVKITMAEGATKTEIEQAILDSQLVANALTEWEGKAAYVPGQYFLADETVLPETLTADFAYTATYEPERYDLTFAENPTIQVPYGYQVLMTPHADSAQSYDYFIGTTYYPQGSVYTVTGDTVVTRDVGKAYTGYTVNGLVANNYFGTDAKAQAILTSGALNIGNEAINVRVPDNDTNIVTLNGNTLTANNYPSSYNNLEWAPYSYKVVSGGSETTYFFAGVNEVTITEGNFDRVEVTYRLTLTNLDSAYVLQIAQLPATLVKEAKDQKSVLDTLAGKSGDMAGIKKVMFTGAKAAVEEDATIDSAVKTRFIAVIDGIINDCIDTDNLLKIYKLMEAYNDPNNGGLRYYYQNSEAVVKEINTLADYLNTLLTDAELRAVMVSLLTDLGYGEYIDKLDSLKGYMDDAKAKLKAPNAAINLKDAVALGKLTTALELSGDVANVASVNDLYIDANPIVVNASTKATITVTVSVSGKDPVSITPQTYNKDHVLTQGDINALVLEINNAIAQLGVADKYYTTDYAESIFQALVGQEVSALTKFSYAFTWTAKTFKVTVEGGNDQYISVDNLEIILPHGTAITRYEYIIDGVRVNSGSYKFTLAQIDKLFATGEYHIAREEIDVGEENLIAFINGLNTSIGNNGIVFALTKDAAGEYAIVMKVNAANVSEAGTAVKNMAMALATSYSYIAFGDNALADDAKISIQAVIDTLMESGFGSQTLIAMMDANGNIQSMAMPGTVLTDKAMTAAGGSMVKTSLVLGNSATAVEYDVPLYITLGSAPAAMTQVRNLLANQLAPYFSFVLEGGKAKVNVTLPGKAYEAYLAVLLASGEVDITDVNDINEKVAVGFMMDIIHPLVASGASASTIQNTLEKFGYNLNLSGYDQAFEYLRKLYNSTVFSYNENDSTYDADANISIKGFVDSMNLGSSLNGLIAEYNTGLDVCVGINLNNLDKTYEALYFDIGATGITNKFGLVENVSAKLSQLAGTSVVILLSDVNADLTFGTTTVLNLNGHTVNGNITGNGTVRIVDTAISTAVTGKVNGTVSGNVKVTGGVYSTDVTAFLSEGYSQNAYSGAVSNNYFNLSKDPNGDISVELNAGMLNTNKMPELTTLAVDIIAELLVNGYTANSLYIDGNQVYDIQVQDLIGIYTSANTTQALMDQVMDMFKIDELKTLVNLLLADITDFEGMLATMNSDIANGTDSALLSYEMKTGTWGFAVEYKDADDSLTASIVSNGQKVRNLNIVIVGTKEEKQHVANLLGILAETTDADVSIDNVSGGKVEGGFQFNLGASGNVVVDLSNDSKYAVMLGVILADGIADNADLVTGLKTYFEEGTMDALEAAFNKVKVSQVIDAIENVYKGENLTTMLANLGLSGYDAADAIALEAEVGAFVKLMGAALRRVNIAGTATTLGSFLDSDTGAYTWDKENLARSLSATLGGYKFTFQGTLVDGFVSIKLFQKQSAPTVNYDALKEQINIAEGLNEAEYTTDSWADLETALQAAYEALNSQDQAVVDKAAEDLEAAIAALVKKPVPPAVNYTELLAQIAAAKALNKADYTADSWANLENALDIAEAALNSTSQAVVNQAAADLKAAIQALVKKPVVTVDTSRLEKLIATAEALDASDFTAASWANLEVALANAYTALASNNQATVDAAAEALKAAIDALQYKSEPPVIDYTELLAQIAAAEALNEADYTADSWTALAAALANAKEALNSKMQTVVDKAAVELKAAIEALVEKQEPPVVDYTELQKQIAAAEALNEADYTAASWSTLKSALSAAKAALSAEDQATVDAAAAALKAAIAALEKKPVEPTVDTTELAQLIAAAEALNEADYTAESWTALKSALSAAKAAMTAQDQAAVDAAAAALKAAMDGLVKKPAAVEVDYTELKAQIAAAEALNEADYTAESWANLKSALDAAKAALSSNDQAAVDSAAAALKAAIEALVAAKKAVIWPWILVGVVVLAAGAGVGYFLITKKKKVTDNTPLVDYDIEDDVE